MGPTLDTHYTLTNIPGEPYLRKYKVTRNPNTNNLSTSYSHIATVESKPGFPRGINEAGTQIYKPIFNTQGTVPHVIILSIPTSGSYVGRARL